MSKMWLMVIGIVLLLLGIAAFIPSMTWAYVPMWYAILEIVLGIIAIGASSMDKK